MVSIENYSRLLPHHECQFTFSIWTYYPKNIINCRLVYRIKYIFKQFKITMLALLNANHCCLQTNPVSNRWNEEVRYWSRGLCHGPAVCDRHRRLWMVGCWDHSSQCEVSSLHKTLGYSVDSDSGTQNNQQYYQKYDYNNK